MHVRFINKLGQLFLSKTWVHCTTFWVSKLLELQKVFASLKINMHWIFLLKFTWKVVSLVQDLIHLSPLINCVNFFTVRETHFQDVKRVLCFLKWSVDKGQWFKKSNLNLTAFSYANWAGCVFDRRGTSGYCVYIGSNLISWSAKKQHIVARSSTEAEYQSLAHTSAELTWICKIFKDIGFPLSQVPVLCCDNVSAISLASNLVFHARTKHVEIDYHYIRELVLAHLLKVQFVPSQF